MKGLGESIFASVVGVITWEAFSDVAFTLVMAFFCGAIGFLGKYLVQRMISRYHNRKNGRV